MFCPNCGNILPIENQSFCHNCGYNIPEVLYDSEKEVRKRNYESPHGSQHIWKPPTQRYPIKHKKPSRDVRPGPYSKKCLGYSIVSLVIAAIAGFIGFTGFLFGRYGFYPFSYYYPSYSYSPTPMIIMTIIPIFLHFIGLILGIRAKTNSRNAEMIDEMNAPVRIGSVLCVFGIVINAILVVVSITASISLFTSTYFNPLGFY